MDELRQLEAWVKAHPERSAMVAHIDLVTGRGWNVSLFQGADSAEKGTHERRVGCDEGGSQIGLAPVIRAALARWDAGDDDAPAQREAEAKANLKGAAR